MLDCASGDEDQLQTACPLCDGSTVPAQIVDMILTSAASQEASMSAEHFLTWLRTLNADENA
jgi:hypothetical protein